MFDLLFEAHPTFAYWRSTSALSHLNCCVDGPQFDPRIIDLELPIGTALLAVAVLM
jgi:hypothetical protein